MIPLLTHPMQRHVPPPAADRFIDDVPASQKLRAGYPRRRREEISALLWGALAGAATVAILGCLALKLAHG